MRLMTFWPTQWASPFRLAGICSSFDRGNFAPCASTLLKNFSRVFKACHYCRQLYTELACEYLAWLHPLCSKCIVFFQSGDYPAEKP